MIIKMYSDNFRAYLQVLISIITVLIICIALLSLARIGTWLAYPRPDITIHGNDLYLALWTGLRFDLAIVIRLSFIGLILSLGLVLIPFPLSKISWTINRCLGGTVILLVIWLSMANFPILGSLIDQ
jgi:hypothetical protein